MWRVLLSPVGFLIRAAPTVAHLAHFCVNDTVRSVRAAVGAKTQQPLLAALFHRDRLEAKHCAHLSRIFVNATKQELPDSDKVDANTVQNTTVQPGMGFMGAPATIEARLSVIDSPNSAGVVIDALRSVSYTHLTLPTICSV